MTRNSGLEATRLVLIAALVIVASGGCASNPTEEPRNQACAVKTELPFHTEGCLGSIDVAYTYANRPRLASEVNVEPVILQLPALESFYVPQVDSETCYAAALTTAFAFYGYKYEQQQFAKAISNPCIGLGNGPLTFSQMLFAATKTHLRSGGIWYIDTPDAFASKILDAASPAPLPARKGRVSSGSKRALYQRAHFCQLASGLGTNWSWVWAGMDADAWIARQLGISGWVAPTPGPQLIGVPNPPLVVRYLSTLDLYRPITWSATGSNEEPQGAIVPLHGPTELVDRFKERVPVLAGLSSQSFGHVVLLSQIAYLPGGTDYFQDTTRIEWVEVLDPGKPAHRKYRMRGDDFIKQLRFLFAIYQPAHPK